MPGTSLHFFVQGTVLPVNAPKCLTHDPVLLVLSRSRMSGTHYPASLSMGGTSFYSSTLTQKSMTRLHESSIDTSFFAGLDYEFVASGHVTVDKNYAKYLMYNSSVANSTEYGIPFPAPRPCSDGTCSDTSEWAASIQLPSGDPMPINMKLTPITDLLTAVNFPNDPSISLKQSILIAYIADSYCNELENCAAPSPPPAPTAPWPQFLGGTLHSSWSAASGPTGPIYVAWTYTSPPDAPSFYSQSSSPAIGVDGTVYVGSNVSCVVALDGALGLVKWSFSTGSSVQSSPAIGADGTVYFGSNDFFFYALDGTTGTLKWSFLTGGEVASSPAIGNDGTVYFGSADGILYALVGATGAQKWYFSTANQIVSSPAIGFDGNVYVGSADGKLYAIDGDQGMLAWSLQTGGYIDSSPAIGADGTVFIGSSDYKVYAVDGATGAIKWTYLTGASVDGAPAIDIDGTVYIGSSDGNLYAFGATGKLLWKYNTGGSIVSSPAIDVNGNVYIGAISASGSTVYAVNGSSGKPVLLWTTLCGHFPSSPAIGTNGMVYFSAVDGVRAVNEN
jgi:outer membrane protein assembly factor BamB